MKKYVLMATGLALLMSAPVFSNEMGKMDHKKDVRVCKTHCDIMKLEDQIDAYKAQAASADKTVTKESLKKKIQQYEEMLKKLDEKLENQ